MGHLNYLTSKTEEARECYERTLDYTTEASDMHAIYLRLASIYLEQGEVRVFHYVLFVLQHSESKRSITIIVFKTIFSSR